ncbi:hypothetical protein EVAR_102001_1 [Eumeta japonica]|uniref:Uncharacterized protein n=1 Tax=Eumeta variegata TaxID=151549 RepID=A0A4C1SLR4_EUMVA|nr:hypothetical protein EVAR_102001_1 [Eumeta japonica]
MLQYYVKLKATKLDLLQKSKSYLASSARSSAQPRVFKIRSGNLPIPPEAPRYCRKIFVEINEIYFVRCAAAACVVAIGKRAHLSVSMKQKPLLNPHIVDNYGTLHSAWLNIHLCNSKLSRASLILELLLVMKHHARRLFITGLQNSNAVVLISSEFCDGRPATAVNNKDIDDVHRGNVELMSDPAYSPDLASFLLAKLRILEAVRSMKDMFPSSPGRSSIKGVRRTEIRRVPTTTARRRRGRGLHKSGNERAALAARLYGGNVIWNGPFALNKMCFSRSRRNASFVCEDRSRAVRCTGRRRRATMIWGRLFYFVGIVNWVTS